MPRHAGCGQSREAAAGRAEGRGGRYLERRLLPSWEGQTAPQQLFKRPRFRNSPGFLSPLLGPSAAPRGSPAGSSLTDSSVATNRMVGVRGSGGGQAAKWVCGLGSGGPRQLDTRPQEEATPAPVRCSQDGSEAARTGLWVQQATAGRERRQVAGHLSQEQGRAPRTHLRVENGSHGFKRGRGERRFGAMMEAGCRKGSAELPWELGAPRPLRGPLQGRQKSSTASFRHPGSAAVRTRVDSVPRRPRPPRIPNLEVSVSLASTGPPSVTTTLLCSPSCCLHPTGPQFENLLSVGGWNLGSQR